MSRTTSAANGGGLPQNCAPGHEDAIPLRLRWTLLIRPAAGDSWTRVSHGCGPTTEESPGSTQSRQGRYSHAVSSENATFWPSSKPSHLASRSKMSAVSWPAWTPTISISSCCLAACRL